VAGAVRGRAVRPIGSISSLFSPNTLHAGRPGSSTHRHRARGRLLCVQYCSAPAMRHLPPCLSFSGILLPSLSPRLTFGLWPPPERLVPCGGRASGRINNDWAGRPRSPARFGSPSFMLCLIAGCVGKSPWAVAGSVYLC
jgi:hypothetical protein